MKSVATATSCGVVAPRIRFEPRPDQEPGCDDAVDYSDCVELADRTILATAEIQIAVAAQSRRSTGRTCTHTSSGKRRRENQSHGNVPIEIKMRAAVAGGPQVQVRDGASTIYCSTGGVEHLRAACPFQVLVGGEIGAAWRNRLIKSDVAGPTGERFAYDASRRCAGLLRCVSLVLVRLLPASPAPVADCI